MSGVAEKLFEIMKKEKCRQITFHFNPNTGLKLIWVIDSIPDMRDERNVLKLSVSTSGGTRFAHKNADDALKDAIKLARAMSRKAKVLGVMEGGSKAVVLANIIKSKKLLHSIGDFIQIHKGLFKTAIDLGFTTDDALKIAEKTEFIDSLDTHLSKGLGSTGENTAEGLVYAYEVIADKILNKDFKDLSVAIQGLGAVGMALAKRLIKRGVKVIGADINLKRVKEAKRIGVKIVNPLNILFQKVDIISPCALGGVITKENVNKLQCKVIAGGANNPLRNENEINELLIKKGIIYVPDFVINVGGFLQALIERRGGTLKEARQKSRIVKEKLEELIILSKKENKSLLEIALELYKY